MRELNDIERGDLVKSAWECYRSAESLSRFSKFIKAIIEFRAWEKRVHGGRVFELKSFRELITAKPHAGWGEDPKKIEAVIKDDGEVLALFQQHMVGEHGGDRKSEDFKPNNVSLDFNHGNSRGYSLVRVQKECDPETVQAVMTGKMSPNAALVKAGKRKARQVWLPEDPKAALQSLIKKFGNDFVNQMLAAYLETAPAG